MKIRFQGAFTLTRGFETSCILSLRGLRPVMLGRTDHMPSCWPGGRDAPPQPQTLTRAFSRPAESWSTMETFLPCQEGNAACAGILRPLEGSTGTRCSLVDSGHHRKTAYFCCDVLSVGRRCFRGRGSYLSDGGLEHWHSEHVAWAVPGSPAIWPRCKERLLPRAPRHKSTSYLAGVRVQSAVEMFGHGRGEASTNLER